MRTQRPSASAHGIHRIRRAGGAEANRVNQSPGKLRPPAARLGSTPARASGKRCANKGPTHGSQRPWATLRRVCPNTHRQSGAPAWGPGAAVGAGQRKLHRQAEQAGLGIGHLGQPAGAKLGLVAEAGR